MDNPVADGPSCPESGMSDEAISAAERGRQFELESAVCGSTATRRAIWDHERAAKKRGEVKLDAERLLEYPRAREQYMRLMSELRGWLAAESNARC